MLENLNVKMDGASTLSISLNSAARHEIKLVSPTGGGTRNYNLLDNKPSVNGVVLIGDTTIADLGIVSENTLEGWGNNPSYVPKLGEICLYSDANKIKVGDGVVSIVDLPFVDGGSSDAIIDTLHGHISNNVVHISQSEREFWNAKLNYGIIGEELVFNRN